MTTARERAREAAEAVILNDRRSTRERAADAASDVWAEEIRRLDALVLVLADHARAINWTDLGDAFVTRDVWMTEKDQETLGRVVDRQNGLEEL